MRPMLPAAALIAALAFVAPAHADDDGSFVVKLGTDTVSVEHYHRTADRTVVDQVGRAPRVLRRSFTYEHPKGVLTALKLVVTPPGAANPTQTIDGTVDGDSLRLKIQNGSAPPQNSAAAWPKGAFVVASSSPWANYEQQFMRFVPGKADSVRGNMLFLGAGAPDWVSIHRLGRDSVAVANGHLDVFHARVDRQGRLLGVMPVSGTGKVAVERVAKLDVGAMAASWAAREKAGAGLGMLSPRDTVNAQAGGAALWIDYGRPGKRGRNIYGDVVPFGEVWRTGANAATQFRTDKALDFGGVTVPAGFYTLWTVPGPNGWKLIVNGETGEWGTAHKPEKDLYTIDMQTSALPDVVERFTIRVEPAADGGTLAFDWDRTRASVAFKVAP